MSEVNAPTRLLLVDDEWLVRAGLHTMLTGQPAITIVGEASDGSAVCEQMQTPAPTWCSWTSGCPK